jgi:hypothetical protein
VTTFLISIFSALPFQTLAKNVVPKKNLEENAICTLVRSNQGRKRMCSEAMLPDGIFFEPKIQIWVNFWKVLQWKILRIFKGHFVYFRTRWYI